MTISKKFIYIYTVLSLALTVPAPGRFAIGFLLAFEINLLMLLTILFRYLVMKLNLGQITDLLTIAFIIFLTMLYRQLVSIISPSIVIQIGFTMFIPSVSSYFVGCVFSIKEKTLSSDLKKNITHIGAYSIFMLIFFLLRDIIGFGTFTYITFSGMVEKVIFDTTQTSTLSFVATIPGTLLMFTLILMLYIFIINKLNIVDRVKQVVGNEEENK